VAGHGRKPIDEQAAYILAIGGTPQQAAEKCQCTVQVIYRRLMEEPFRERLAELQREFFSRTIGQLNAMGPIAAEKLRELLSSANEPVRLGAIRTTLDNQSRGMELEQLSRQVTEQGAAITALRNELEAIHRERNRDQAADGTAEGRFGIVADSGEESRAAGDTTTAC
jgi:hypothetical protein